MNLPPSAAAPAPSLSAPRRNWPHLLANAAVTIVVLAVAAATFVLSYAGVHAIALQGGVSVQLARIYPGLFDAVLVIACVAAVVLRDGRWWARCWAWLIVIVVLGAIGTTDVLHAMNYELRHRPTEGVVAAAPVVAVLLAFSLLLTMLRQTRSQASGAPPRPRGRAARRAAREQSAAAAIAAPIDATRVDLVPVDVVPVDAVPVDAVPVVAAAEIPGAVSPAIAETPVMPAYPGDADETAGAGQEHFAPGAAPTREDAALSATAPATPEVVEALDAPETPDNSMAAGTSERADSPALNEQSPPAEPTGPAEALGPEAPSAADAQPDAEPDAYAEPDADEPAAGPSPQPAQAPRPAPGAIRYASSAASESDYWDSEVDPDLAGQVYPVLTSDPDIDTSRYQPDEPKDVDDADAPPFATAPFASVPRLNRMRVTPIPPTDSDDED